jgi:hypothetical protein
VELVTTEALSPYIGTSWLRLRMSFEPLEYLRHIAAEADYLVENRVARSKLPASPLTRERKPNYRAPARELRNGGYGLFLAYVRV